MGLRKCADSVCGAQARLRSVTTTNKNEDGGDREEEAEAQRFMRKIRSTKDTINAKCIAYDGTKYIKSFTLIHAPNAPKREKREITGKSEKKRRKYATFAARKARTYFQREKLRREQ